MQMIEEQISKIAKKLEDIETIFETHSAESWDEHRRGKVGAFYVYSLDKLLEEKRQLREKENLLLAQKVSPAGKKFTLSQYLVFLIAILYLRKIKRNIIHLSFSTTICM